MPYPSTPPHTSHQDTLNVPTLKAVDESRGTPKKTARSESAARVARRTTMILPMFVFPFLREPLRFRRLACREWEPVLRAHIHSHAIRSYAPCVVCVAVRRPRPPACREWEAARPQWLAHRLHPAITVPTTFPYIYITVCVPIPHQNKLARCLHPAINMPAPVPPIRAYMGTMYAAV